MREMKDSGIPWVGRIPAEWKALPIGALFRELTQKNTFGKEKRALQFKMGQIVPKTNFDADVEDYVANTITNYTLVSPGTIMINGLNLNFDFVTQRVAQVKDYGVITSAYMSIKPNDNGLNSDYATYLLKTYDNCKAFHNMGGGVRKILNFDELRHAYVIVPSLIEQQRIAEFLDKKCSEIDNLIADIHTQIDTLEQYKRSQIAEAVTRGLVSKEPLKESGLAWIGNIPDHWKVVPNKHLMKKLKLIQPVYAGEDIISLTVNGVIKRDLENPSGKMPTSFDGYQFVYPGNLLMCLFDIDVTPRCIGLIKDFGLTSPAYSQFVLNSKADAGYYYYYYLNLDFNKDLLHLAKNQRHSLNEEQFGAIPTVVPPIEEQKAIAAYLDEKCTEIDGCIAAKKEQISTLEAYKKSVIFEYVTGKKEVVYH